jgi:3',5'-cyclic-AMP phosphodiesterase
VRRSVRLLSTPSTCAQFQPRSNDFVIDNLPPAYRLLTLHSNGAIDTGVHFLTAAESAA